jgi:deazaflavin-dependent oxidoreductase (nitroreductase family)
MKTRIFFITFTVANLGLILYGILVLIKPEILLESFLVHVYQFPQEAADATTYLSALYRLLGYFNIIPGMVGLYILHHYWVTRQEWCIGLVLASTSLSYIGPVVFDNTVGTIGFFEILEHILLLLVISVGFIMLNPKKKVPELINRHGATRLGLWIIKHLVSPLQRWIYHTTGGRIMSNLGKDRNVLLLTTKGHLTGKDRTTPVFYLRDGEKVVICNVKPEHEGTNPWVINLRNNPLARLQIRQETAQYQAQEAKDGDIDRLWPRLIKLWPAFQSHYERGGRRSIFTLERVAL